MTCENLSDPGLGPSLARPWPCTRPSCCSPAGLLPIRKLAGWQGMRVGFSGAFGKHRERLSHQKRGCGRLCGAQPAGSGRFPVVPAVWIPERVMLSE